MLYFVYNFEILYITKIKKLNKNKNKNKFKFG